MFLAKVKGNVVSTPKDKNLIGYKLLITQPIDFTGKYLSDKEVISIDLVDAGIGDIVLVVQEGDAVQQILGNSATPVNTIIVAIVDNIEIND